MQITDVVAQLEDIKIILVYLVCAVSMIFGVTLFRQFRKQVIMESLMYLLVAYTIVGFVVTAIVWAIGFAVSGLLSTIFKNNF